MDNVIVLAAIADVAAWVVAGFGIWKWGPGSRRRGVRCPSSLQKATVRAEQEEAEFGCLRVTDVKTCSLIPNQVLTCGKKCMALL